LRSNFTHLSSANKGYHYLLCKHRCKPRDFSSAFMKTFHVYIALNYRAGCVHPMNKWLEWMEYRTSKQHVTCQHSAVMTNSEFFNLTVIPVRCSRRSANLKLSAGVAVSASLQWTFQASAITQGTFDRLKLRRLVTAFRRRVDIHVSSSLTVNEETGNAACTYNTHTIYFQNISSRRQ